MNENESNYRTFDIVVETPPAMKRFGSGKDDGERSKGDGRGAEVVTGP